MRGMYMTEYDEISKLKAGIPIIGNYGGDYN